MSRIILVLKNLLNLRDFFFFFENCEYFPLTQNIGLFSQF